MTILTDMADKLTALSSGAAVARMEEDAMRVTEQVSHAIFQQWSGSKITAQEWMDLGKEESPPGLENSLEPRGHGMTGGQETDWQQNARDVAKSFRGGLQGSPVRAYKPAHFNKSP